MASWLEAKRGAEALNPKLTLQERDHWRATEGYKRYDVVLDGKVLGLVEQRDETLERRTRGSRTVNYRWNRKAWGYEAPGLDSHRLYYLTRKRAISELVEHLILKGLLQAPV
jgi:hypothetical protein